MGQNTSYSQMLLFLSAEKNLILKFSVKLYDFVWETREPLESTYLNSLLNRWLVSSSNSAHRKSV